MAESPGPWVGSRSRGFSAHQVRPVVFNGLHGYRGSYSWDLGTDVTYMLFRKPYMYLLSLTTANAAQVSNRQALDAALNSFKFTD
jgi:hypothetical protein